MDSTLSFRVARTSRQLSLLLRVVIFLAVSLGILLLAGSVLAPELLQDWVRGIYPQVTFVTAFQIFLLAVIAVVQLALTTVALWWLARMFDCCSRDEPLSLEAASMMRSAGRWFLAATIYAMLAQIPSSLVVSMNQPEGARFISLGLSSSHASGVLASFVLYAIASIQELAAMVRDDNRQIV